MKISGFPTLPSESNLIEVGNSRSNSSRRKPRRARRVLRRRRKIVRRRRAARSRT